jgi:hypothetical protein
MRLTYGIDLAGGDPADGGLHVHGAEAIAVAEPFLGALMAVRAQKGGDLQLNQLPQAMTGQFRDHLPWAAAIQ